MNIETFKYDNRIVRAFAIATIIWGIVGMLVGMLAAVELFYPGANLNLQFITFGRIRPHPGGSDRTLVTECAAPAKQRNSL